MHFDQNLGNHCCIKVHGIPIPSPNSLEKTIDPLRNSLELYTESPLLPHVMHKSDKMADELVGGRKKRYFNRRPVSVNHQFMEAIKKGELKVLKRLVSQDHLRRVFEDSLGAASRPAGYSPLVVAAQNNHDEIVKHLLSTFKECINLEQESSVNIDSSNIEGATALWTSATLGHLPIVKVLVKAGANVNHGTRSRSTPIRGAAYDGHLSVVKYLAEKGADIHTPNHCGQSPLGIAAAMKRIDCAEYLISRGACVNEMGHNKDTPLHIAVESGDQKVCKLLVKAGAKNIANSIGHTPCMLAACHGHNVLLEYLFKVFSVSIQERYDCYLLLGARKSMLHMDHVTSPWWMKALNLKMAHKEVIPNYPCPNEVYNGVKEPSTNEELLFILADDERCLAFCAVIFERVLGPYHPSTAFTMRGFGDALIEFQRYSACEDVWLRSLEYDRAARMAFELQVVEDILFAVKGFHSMFNVGCYCPCIQPFFDWGIKELQMAKDSKTSEVDIVCALCKLLAMWMRIIDYLCEGPDTKTRGERERRELTTAINTLTVASQSCKIKFSPIIACLRNFTKDEPIYPAVYEIQLPLHRVLEGLLSMGCSQVAHDEERQFALHHAVQMKSHGATDCIDVLVSSGAPLFVCDYQGKTALDVANSVGGGAVVDHVKGIYRQQFSLQSLAAVAIVANRIDYRVGRLPRDLVEFVSWH